jgi:hypothetical protein
MGQVVTALGASPPAHAYGAKHLADHGAPPRVVWERLPASFGEPPTISSNPRMLWNKRIELRLHFWGVDEDACDQMVDNEVAALDSIIHGAYRPTRLEEGAANSAWLAHGYAQVLNLSIDFKVLDKIVPVARTTAIEIDTSNPTSTPGDGWLETGEQ